MWIVCFHAKKKNRIKLGEEEKMKKKRKLVICIEGTYLETYYLKKVLENIYKIIF